MKKKLICVLGALILMNPLSFVFGFHCHFNRSGFYCHRRSACLSRRSSSHISDSNSMPTSRKGKHVFTTSSTPTPVPIVTSTPTPIPTPIPTQVVYRPPVTPVPVKIWHPGDGFFSYGEYKELDPYWHEYLLLGRLGGARGKAYYQVMVNRLVFRQVVLHEEIPSYILENYFRLIAIYDPDSTVFDTCEAIFANSFGEGNHCVYNAYNNNTVYVWQEL